MCQYLGALVKPDIAHQKERLHPIIPFHAHPWNPPSLVIVANSITTVRSGIMMRERHIDIFDPRIPTTRYSTVSCDRFEDLPSPLAVLRMPGEAVRDEEGFDCLRASGEANKR